MFKNNSFFKNKIFNLLKKLSIAFHYVIKFFGRKQRTNRKVNQKIIFCPSSLVQFCDSSFLPKPSDNKEKTSASPRES